jgi:DMSO/TMAO reductase YedYZ molybdopterin-dependent catalytic subunit
MEDQLAPGQVWGKKFVIYAALGVPRIDSEKWRLKVDGLVAAPAEFTYSQLRALPQKTSRKPAQCVTKWSIRDSEWEGVPLRDLIAKAGPRPEATWVMFHCEEGYTTPVPMVDAMSEESLLAMGLNGRPLTAEQGFPARPFIPDLYLWKSAKWVNRIELMENYRDGYWEAYGYHERANVWEEERFKGTHGKAVRRTALGTA